MIIKKITLNNIRSYEQQTIDFSEGSTLLVGDIGSGKTSILLGIEFALFGLQPGQRGSSLLRNGEDKGSVQMEFEIEGNKIIVERTLKKGKTITQDSQSITINDEKQEMSVTEIKNRILTLLNYPQEFSKKQNFLYKFTVYTPQEEMKQIILQDSETRINTLRHVFGIDKYKKILENISIVLAKIREEKRFYEALTSNLEKEKQELNIKQNKIKEKENDLSLLESELNLKKEIRKKIDFEKQELTAKKEEKSKLEQEIEKTKIMILNKQESIFENKKIIQELKEQIQELNKLEFNETELTSLENDLKKFHEEKESLNERVIQISSRINALMIKNQENDSIKNKLAQIEICPTCLQDVTPVYKGNVLNKIESNNTKNVSEIKSLELEKIEISESIYKINSQISIKEKKIQNFNMIKIKLQNIEEKQNNLEKNEKMKKLFEKDIEILNQHINSLKNSVFELSKYSNLFEKKQEEFENALKEERIAEIKIAEIKKEIDVSLVQIKEIIDKIKKTEEIEKKLKYIGELDAWISDKFVPLISFIEKNVMIKLKTEFSKLFSEWFSMLVSDSLNVQLRDDFTPIIENQDYEIDYNYLSGGERTAVALAYRLSLNQVINSLLSKLKTLDLVILDEPTDGFSEQQLDKMRDVLQQLNVNQLIIVSHEQKIEGFVEKVIKFRKEAGISIVE